MNLLPGSFRLAPGVYQLYQQNLYVNFVPRNSLDDSKLSTLNVQADHGVSMLGEYLTHLSNLIKFIVGLFKALMNE